MSGWAIVAIVAAALVVARAALALVRALRHPVVARARIVTEAEHTEIDERRRRALGPGRRAHAPGGARSTSSGPRCTSSASRARTGASCRACTLGLIRVALHRSASASSCCCTRPFVLLRFQAPEYEMDERPRRRALADRARPAGGRGADATATATSQIDVRAARAGDADGLAVVRVEVEVANFYPTIASAPRAPVYTHTQSRIHVIVTHGFLRSLARLDLAESRVGRFAPAGDVGPRCRSDAADVAQ